MSIHSPGHCHVLLLDNLELLESIIHLFLKPIEKEGLHFGFLLLCY